MNHAQNGSVIISDKSTSYLNVRTNTLALDPLGFNHYWVNHSLEWVHPLNRNINTNTIERVWRSLKGSISHIKRSVSAEDIEDYINTFLMRCYFNEEILVDIMLHIMSQFTE